MAKKFDPKTAAPGSKWPTRGGQTFTFASYNPEAHKEHVVAGWVGGQLLGLCSNGHYFSSGNTSPYDIVDPPPAIVVSGKHEANGWVYSWTTLAPNVTSSLEEGVVLKATPSVNGNYHDKKVWLLQDGPFVCREQDWPEALRIINAYNDRH